MTLLYDPKLLRVFSDIVESKSIKLSQNYNPQPVQLPGGQFRSLDVRSPSSSGVTPYASPNLNSSSAIDELFSNLMSQADFFSVEKVDETPTDQGVGSAQLESLDKFLAYLSDSRQVYNNNIICYSKDNRPERYQELLRVASAKGYYPVTVNNKDFIVHGQSIYNFLTKLKELNSKNINLSIKVTRFLQELQSKGVKIEVSAPVTPSALKPSPEVGAGSVSEIGTAESSAANASKPTATNAETATSGGVAANSGTASSGTGAVSQNGQEVSASGYSQDQVNKADQTIIEIIESGGPLRRNIIMIDQIKMFIESCKIVLGPRSGVADRLIQEIDSYQELTKNSQLNTNFYITNPLQTAQLFIDHFDINSLNEESIRNYNKCMKTLSNITYYIDSIIPELVKSKKIKDAYQIRTQGTISSSIRNELSDINQQVLKKISGK